MQDHFSYDEFETVRSNRFANMNSLLPNAQTLNRLVKERKIRRKWHKTYKHLAIYKYKGGFDFFHHEDARFVKWCRGLVYDHKEDRVVACPMPKFHNHFEYPESELKEILSSGNYYVTKKVDGSCVLAWYYMGEWYFSTLFGINSNQAQKARSLLERIGSLDDFLNPERTYIFEVVYPQNRIVLNYGSEESLTYITEFDPRTGHELWNKDFKVSGNGFECSGQSDEAITINDLSTFVQSGTGVEGYVVTIQRPDADYDIRIKFKTQWYFNRSWFYSRIQVDGLVKTLSKRVASGDPMPQIPEFEGEINSVCSAVESLIETISSAVPRLQQLSTRAAQKERILTVDMHQHIQQALIDALNGKDETIALHVWKALEDEHVDTISEKVSEYESIILRL